MVSALNDQELDALVDEVCRIQALGSTKEGSLIPILQDIQAKIGYLPKRALKRVSSHLGIFPSLVYGVATFYHQFRMRPEGKHIITVCRGTACHVAGTTDIYKFLMRHLKIIPPDDTSLDGLFTIKQVRCIGACSLAPVIKIDDEVYGRLDPKKLHLVLDRHRRMWELI